MTPARLGWLVAVAALLADQLSKNFLLYGLDFRALGPAARIAVLPFFDLVMVWNRGVSYGLMQAGSFTGTRSGRTRTRAEGLRSAPVI